MGHFYFSISGSLSSHLGRRIVPASHPYLWPFYVDNDNGKYNFFIFQSVCAPIWDGASCLPPTLAGHTAVLPCMTFYDGVFYSPECKIVLEQLSRNLLLPWILLNFPYMCLNLVNLSFTFLRHLSESLILTFINSLIWETVKRACKTLSRCND